MSVPSQRGAFIFGLKSAKSTDVTYDATAIKASVSVFGQALPYTVAAPGNPAAASRIGFTVLTDLGTGDATFLVQGTLGGEAVQDIVNLASASPAGTVLYTNAAFDAIVSITLLEQSTVSGTVAVGAYTLSTGAVSTWLSHKVMDVNLGAVQDQRTYPLEVGGDLTPNNGYKASAFVAGGASMQPRLDGDAFASLLLATLGLDTMDGGGAPAAGHSHAFTMNTDQSVLPWLDVRKYIPAAPNPSGVSLGEEGIDCRVASMRLTIPQVGLMQSRFDFQGRVPKLTRGASGAGWTLGLVYDDDATVPVSCETTGTVQIPSGTELPIQNLVIQFTNNFSSPQQEMLVGAPHPDDFVVLSRAMTLQATLKWNVPDVYEKIIQYATAASAWSAKPWTSSFKAVVNASKVVGGTTHYGLTIENDTVMWAVSGAPVLAGGDLLLLPITGTVMKPTGGNPYAKFTLINAKASAYTAP